jgi:hypothetical protein
MFADPTKASYFGMVRTLTPRLSLTTTELYRIPCTEQRRRLFLDNSRTGLCGILLHLFIRLSPDRSDDGH